MEILRMIAADEEIQALKKQWIDLHQSGKTNKPCLGFNFDDFGGIEDYRNALKEGINNILNS